MFWTWAMATAHYLALGIGLGGVFVRGQGFRQALRGEPGGLARAFQGDNAWGIAALLWLPSGLLRAFGGLEKGTDWYLHNPMFHLKLTLFGLLFLAELWPMVTLIRWRIREAKGQPVDPAAAAPALRWFVRINDAEVVGILLLVAVATAMARNLRPF